MPHRPEEHRRTVRLLLGICALCLLLLVWLWRQPPSAQGNPTPAAIRVASDDARAETRPDSDSTPLARGAVGSTGMPATAATGDDACWRDRRAQYRVLRDRVDPTVSPTDATTHALLTRMLTMTQPDSLDVQREVTAAATQWPDDMELAWLAYDTCNERRGCDRPAALANLQCGRRQRLRLAA